VTDGSRFAYNPYDFANPVTEREIFAGREADLIDASYYLREAKNTRPIHLALTGERSAGKTSMLNMVANEASSLGFLVVKLDLNEGDSEPIQFFARLYDALLLAVVRDDKFGGTHGKTWLEYRALVDSDTPATNLPLAFPSHMVAAMKGTRNLSIAVLSQDLLDIQREVDRRVVVILDECDVLSASKISLQILRNLFTVLDKFMFVIAGTPRLFDVIDDVFSPIVRQFKKIVVASFADTDDTSQCISQPLSKLGVDPKSVFLNWPLDVNEIHRITGGRPYEIRLLCHTMFRRMQQGLEGRMTVNLEALDAVRSDLEHSQAQSLGRLSHLYQDLSREQLSAVGLVRAVRGGRASEAMVLSKLSESRAPLESEFRMRLSELVDLGILTQTDDSFVLSGDQFDEIYLRYLAASRDVQISARPLPASVLMEIALRNVIHPALRPRANAAFRNNSVEEFREKIDIMLASQAQDSSSQIRASEWAAIYRPMLRAQDEGQTALNFAVFVVSVAGVALKTYFPSSVDELEVLFEEDKYRAFLDTVAHLGGSMTVAIESFSIEGLPPIADLAPDSVALKASVAMTYEEEAYQFFDAEDYAAASTAFRAAYELRPTPFGSTAVAYQYLYLHEWQEVVTWTTLTLANEVGETETGQHCVAAYDRAIAQVMLQEVDLALADLDLVRTLWQETPSHLNVHLSRLVRDADLNWKLVTADQTIVEEAGALAALLAA
jgi:hypothetical protein